MEFKAVYDGLFPPTGANVSHEAGNVSTTDHRQHMKAVESVLALLGLRGLAPLYGLVGGLLGVEPSNILTTIGIVWALNKLLRRVFSFLHRVISDHLMSSMHIASNDDIYMHLMAWLAAQPKLASSRNLTAETAQKKPWEEEDASNVTRDLSGRWLNFSNQQARTPAQYSPAVGLHGFWWKGRYYRLDRKRESVINENAYASTIVREHEDLTISCFGRNPEPIKRLLADAKEQYYRHHQARTIVKRPNMLKSRRYGGRGAWEEVANRPARDIRTVILDDHQKLQVLADINEYLHPDTPQWYADRGIPLRRGYLFHGPPGTGKTSLSFALAGIFGLDIHVISLLEPTLTEEELGSLFASLPRRCIVLLEDIDTAGLRRPPSDSAKDEREAAALDTKKDWKVSDLAKALKKHDQGEQQQKVGISLSGLLNAIDGVASHEGRVLIMTTNTPEQLDEALIRPGRVDLQVAFANATREQARELFVRMYDSNQPSSSSSSPSSEKVGLATTVLGSIAENDLDINPEALPAIAEEFGNKVPDGEFSPAQIQGYLLKRKKHPRQALEEADKWVEGLVKQKATRSKVVQVQ
ncbi:P-loop containing nucleoside triphosphate hydrolase protein [Hypoxylon crocopeplum]|nr:P-loop containing nucleoside triphosphate hydrolase protein [Hypoxylon crocopeplum]